MSPVFYVVTILLLVSFTIPTSAATDDVDTLDGSSRASVTVAQLLWVHNAARQAVGVPALTWSTKLAQFARAYAETLRAGCQLEHSPGFDYGENLFWGRGHHWSAAAAAGKWVDEREWYHHDSNSCSPGQDCTHYTQVVWRNTQQLGCAKIVCQLGDTLLVCEYYPPGNYEGARPY